MQLALWWTAGKETWSVQLDSYTSHNVRRNNLNTGCFPLHTNTLTASVATTASAT